MTFAEFLIREGKAVNRAFAQGGEAGSYMLLVLSLRWADTGEPVFADVDVIEALPFRLRNTLVRLSAKAATANGMGISAVATTRSCATPTAYDAGEAAGPSS